MSVGLIQLACDCRVVQEGLASHTQHTLTCFFLPLSFFFLLRSRTRSFYKNQLLQTDSFLYALTLHEYVYYSHQNEDAKTDLKLFFIHLLQGQIIEITCIKYLLIYITRSSTACYIKYKGYVKRKMAV